MMSGSTRVKCWIPPTSLDSSRWLVELCKSTEGEKEVRFLPQKEASPKSMKSVRGWSRKFQMIQLRL